MNAIEAARKLGVAIQADPAYVRFAKAMLDSEKNEELQKKIGDFNIKRMNLDAAVSAEEKDEAKIKELNEELRKLYDDIMADATMVEFNEARQGVDKLLNDVNAIISMSAQGADPETCEISDCTGNCSSCGGCH